MEGHTLRLSANIHRNGGISTLKQWAIMVGLAWIDYALYQNGWSYDDTLIRTWILSVNDDTILPLFSMLLQTFFQDQQACLFLPEGG